MRGAALALSTAIAGLLAAALAGGEDAAALAIRIRPAAEVAAPVIRIGDAAEVAGPSATAARIAALPLIDDPGPGRWNVDAALVRAALGPAWSGVPVAGAGVVARARRIVPAADLAAAAMAAAAAAGGEVAASVIRPGADLAVPDHGAAPLLRAEPLDRRQVGPTAYRIVASLDGREVGRGLVVLDVERRVPALVAEHRIPRGSVLTAGDLRPAAVPLSRGGADPVADPALLIGRRLRRDIEAGSVLAPGDAIAVAAVAGGQDVALIWSAGRVTVTASGVALNDAAVGEAVNVRRPDGRTVRGQVLAPGQVRIGGG